MRSGLSMMRARGSSSFPPSTAWSVRQVTARASLSKKLLIEKLYRLHPKFSLYSWNGSSYGPTITRLATKLRQTKGRIKMKRFRVCFIFLLILSGFFSNAVSAQDQSSSHGNLGGTVLDKTEAVVAGARVTLVGSMGLSTKATDE